MVAARVAAVLTAARGARWPAWCRTGSGSTHRSTWRAVARMRQYSPQHVARGGPHGAARVAAVLTAARGARWPAWCRTGSGSTHRSTWRAVARMVHGAARVAAVLTAARGARWPAWCRTGSGSTHRSTWRAVARMVHGAARVAAVLTAARGARWPAWCMVPHG
ncbi:hypothetical protein ACJJTC_019718 [Scirpophaga incertulas]